MEINSNQLLIPQPADRPLVRRKPARRVKHVLSLSHMASTLRLRTPGNLDSPPPAVIRLSLPPPFPKSLLSSRHVCRHLYYSPCVHDASPLWGHQSHIRLSAICCTLPIAVPFPCSSARGLHIQQSASLGPSCRNPPWPSHLADLQLIF